MDKPTGIAVIFNNLPQPEQTKPNEKIEVEDDSKWISEHRQYMRDHNREHTAGCSAREDKPTDSATVGYSRRYADNYDATFGKN